MDYNKYLESINDDINNQNNQRQLSSNPNYHIEKHISHHNYDDKTKQNKKNIAEFVDSIELFLKTFKIVFF